MAITGLTRVRNEELIIEDTLKHHLRNCDQIILFDDASTDRTAEIAESFSRITVLRSLHWNENREFEETAHRALLLQKARERGAEWCFYFDADERLDGELPDVDLLPRNVSAFKFILLDAYMTHELCEDYTGGELASIPRMWGPEARHITMLFRQDRAEFMGLDQREPVVMGDVVLSNTCVKHYGKSISKQHYYDTCDYYINHFPKYAKKWQKRKEAGHLRTNRSDFGYHLYTWAELMEMRYRLPRI